MNTKISRKVETMWVLPGSYGRTQGLTKGNDLRTIPEMPLWRKMKRGLGRAEG